MVRYRKPVERSDNIIDRRSRQSPRGTRPLPPDLQQMRDLQRMADEAMKVVLRLRRMRSGRG